MRNPVAPTKSGRKLNGTTGPINIEVISADMASALLANAKRQGIYRPHIPNVVAALRRLGPDEHIKFRTPAIQGRTVEQNCKRLMSVVNVSLKTLKINHRIRHVMETDILVSEPMNWGTDSDN